MPGPDTGAFGDEEQAAPESRRLTPQVRVEREPSSDAANEDFLFHLYRGSELLQDNRVHEAKEELEQALQLQPRDAKGQDLLGVVYFRLGLYPRAIAIYEQLKRKSPREPALLLNLALCYLKSGQPALARSELETLVEVNPGHARAWGYLGLACERLGDLAAAQRAFEQGGHAQMARRMEHRRSVPAPGPRESQPSRDVREAVATAFEELDAGELSFALAEPESDSRDGAGEAWRSIELGQPLLGVRSETAKPDTKDGPPQTPPRIPQLGPPPSVDRRPTLIAPAPPAPAGGYAFSPDRLSSPAGAPFTLDDAAAPSLRRPLVAVPPVSVPGEASLTPPGGPRRKTLPPPMVRPPSAPPPPVSRLAEEVVVAFPEPGKLLVHPSGVALVHTTEAGFATRLEAVRVSSNGLSMKLLERQAKGKPTGESFGGVGSPFALAAGDGRLVLAARPGRKLSSFALEGDMCFVREEVLLGFHGDLAFENGRLATGEGEFVAIVQLRGEGPVVLESAGEILSLDVQANRGISVRREVVLGWFGRLVPRALAPSEAPCGQRGMVSFAGDGRVLVASG